MHSSSWQITATTVSKESYSYFSHADHIHSSGALEATSPTSLDGSSSTHTQPVSVDTTEALLQRRKSVTSVKSLTPSEKALVNQSFWSFSIEYLTKLAKFLLDLPGWSGWRPINALEGGASDENRAEWRARGDKLQRAKLGLWE